MVMMDERAKALASDTELKNYGLFLDGHVQQLEGVLKSLRESVSDGGGSVGGDPSDFNPLSLQSAPCEQLPLRHIVDSENKMLSKVVLALASLCAEMDALASEARCDLYDPLLLYGEGRGGGDDDGDDDEGDAQIGVSRLLPTLQRACSYAGHCQKVVLNLLQQLSVLYGPDSVLATDDVHLHVVFDHLGRLLMSLVTLDDIVQGQTCLREHWSAYQRMIKTAQLDPARFDIGDAAKLKRLEKLLEPIDRWLFREGLFQTLLRQSYDQHGVLVTRNARLFAEASHALRVSTTELELELNRTFEPDQRLKVVGTTALLALFATIYQMPDKKFQARMWELYKKIPGITLHGNVMWFPEQFLFSCLPSYAGSVDKKLLLSVTSARQAFLQAKAQTIAAEVKAAQGKLTTWLIRLETVLKRPSGSLSLDDLQRKCDLLLHGLELAAQFRQTAADIVNLHGKLSVPMTKTSVISLCKLLELLKSVEHMFVRHATRVADVTTHVTQHLAYQVIGVVERAKRLVVMDKRYTSTRIDILSSLVLAERAIAGPPTSERRLVAKLCLSMAAQGRTFGDQDVGHLHSCLQRLSIVSKIQRKVQQACDTSFLYFHRVMLSVYFGHVYENKQEAHRLHYIFCALRDCEGSMAGVKHLEKASQLRNKFEQEVKDAFKAKILDPLCRDLETDLRLQAHAHLKLDDRNPFKTSLNDLSPLMQVTPIRFLGKYINIKAHVECYLEKVFYNLTTVALHNWRTYGEMRALALHKFDAVTVDDHLPAQTLEQGLDVLEIMRNINVFVSRYLYNLNNQIFVEETSNNKHLNTINIGHVANSIRTHGTGIMNTTVNFTYQFLRKKFVIFSQFLYDEHIKSRLIKDIRFFRAGAGDGQSLQNGQKNGQKTAPSYPYERAHKFNRTIRKLGVMPDGVTTYLDQFRMLVSQIGNAMGYVRLIRSGGLHFVSRSIRFLPDLDDIPCFAQLAKDEDLGQDAVDAASMLDEVVANLSKNFAEGTEYFQLLVKVFSKQFNSRRQSHLKTFFAIVPPLTVNYVQHMISAKEKIHKKKKEEGAAFTDDGFAMGVAYILTLLDQWSPFDSLHWFQSVRDWHQRERAAARRQRTSASSASASAAAGEDDDKLVQTLELTLKRLDTQQKEFDLLYYGLSSARIFFRSNEEEEEEEEEKEEEEEGGGGNDNEGNEEKTPAGHKSSPAAAASSTAVEG